ncbi:putative signal transducing protein [Salinimicrobium xinjiangense]|uniref:putative signal transducing protein n=1 Tax=Salinimicrobium xinjiangense TaxID=438596 RepID=UPI0003F4DAB5|nr:DUF2007 domain-containing protein [Salinimicrobium xinjiangense]
MKFVTIYNSPDSFKISIIRNLLEENGIHYQTSDMATDSASGIAGLGITGMRVQVTEDQQEKARELLKARGFS